jgi:hypothetical protein
MSDKAIEQEIQAKGLTAPRVTPQRIQDVIASEHYFTGYHGALMSVGAEKWRNAQTFGGDPEGIPDALKLLTFCVLVLKNGFTVTGESACASPENFDAEIGRKVARDNAISKVWMLEGYLLKQQLHEQKTPSPDNRIDIAKKCHEINRAYCAALGDTSQLPWDQAPEWQRQSAINGVQFHIEHPDAGPDASHNSWLEEKRSAGWKFGPVKDADKKEHPCFVPYDQLPAEQKAKDYLFKQTVDLELGRI